MKYILAYPANSLVSELCPAIATKNVHLIGEHVSYLRKQYDQRKICSKGPETTYQSLKKVLANQRNSVNPLPSVIQHYCDQISDSHKCEKNLKFSDKVNCKDFDNTLFYKFCLVTGERKVYTIHSTFVITKFPELQSAKG